MNANNDPSRPRCGGCIHAVPEGNGLICRRNPATAFLVAQPSAMGKLNLSINGGWPPVKPEHFCGEHPDFMRWSMQRGRASAIAQEPALPQ